MTALLLRKTGRQERRRSGLRPQCGDLSGTGDGHHGEPFAAPEHRALSGVSQHVFALSRPSGGTIRNLDRLELENGSHIISVPGPERTIRGLASVDLIVLDEAARVRRRAACSHQGDARGEQWQSLRALHPGRKAGMVLGAVPARDRLAPDFQQIHGVPRHRSRVPGARA